MIVPIGVDCGMVEFCKKYMLDGTGEEDFTVKEILFAQPHLKDLWN